MQCREASWHVIPAELPEQKRHLAELFTLRMANAGQTLNEGRCARVWTQVCKPVASSTTNHLPPLRQELRGAGVLLGPSRLRNQKASVPARHLALQPGEEE